MGQFVEFLAQFRFCLACERFRYRADPYCGACFKKLKAQNIELKNNHRFLYSWQGEQAEFVKKLIYYLKNFSHTNCYSRLAMEFYLQNPLAISEGKKLFVPAPPRQQGDKDHAYYWAKALCKLYGGEFFLGLKRGEDQAQKLKNREERQQVEILLTGPLPSADEVIFCDDLLTTGATAEAARKALGEPPLYEIWTIAERPRLHYGPES